MENTSIMRCPACQVSFTEEDSMQLHLIHCSELGTMENREGLKQLQLDSISHQQTQQMEALSQYQETSATSYQYAPLPNIEHTTINYKLNETKALNKKSKACDREPIKTKQNQSSTTIRMNTAAFEIFCTTMFNRLLSTYVVKDIKEHDITNITVVHDILQVYTQNNTFLFTINIYRTSSTIMINGPYYLRFTKEDLPILEEQIVKNDDDIRRANTMLKRKIEEEIATRNIQSTNTVSKRTRRKPVLYGFESIEDHKQSKDRKKSKEISMQAIQNSNTLTEQKTTDTSRGENENSTDVGRNGENTSNSELTIEQKTIDEENMVTQLNVNKEKMKKERESDHNPPNQQEEFNQEPTIKSHNVNDLKHDEHTINFDFNVKIDFLSRITKNQKLGFTSIIK